MCAILPAATTTLQPAIAQQEETSLGENENFARGIVSDVLGDGNSEDESSQDATNTAATEDSNQE